MANLQETSTWEAGIYQLETSDPVMGGENGIDNKAPRQLANRTLWLKNELARQIGLVNQANTNLGNQKADKSIAFTAGAGLTGGGNLSANRTLALGMPSKITATSTNTAVSDTHSHEIDKASTTVQGIVKLNDTLTSDSQTEALTANMGRVLKADIDTKLASSAVAGSASKLATARQIALTGAVTGSVNFDGSGNVSIATALNMTEFTNLKTENGYQKLPSGLILQWGDILGSTSQRQIVFPIAFPNNVLNVNLTLKVNSRDLDNSEAFGVFNVTNTGFSIFNWVMPSQGCYWFAIGY